VRESGVLKWLGILIGLNKDLRVSACCSTRALSDYFPVISYRQTHYFERARRRCKLTAAQLSVLNVVGSTLESIPSPLAPLHTFTLIKRV